MDNNHIHWQQGHFVDSREYSNWTKDQKESAERRENLLVRPSKTGNAICQCDTPETAIWIAQRLNLAACYEREKGE